VDSVALVAAVDSAEVAVDRTGNADAERAASMTVEQLVPRLIEAYGATLRTIAIYGSAAGGEHVPTRSDINVLVLVESLPLDALKRVATTSHDWVAAGHPPPLTMTVREWQSSSDVFPMEYADIFERHRVLHGALPTEGIAVTPRDLRLQVEQEALGKLLRLRQHVMAVGDDPDKQLTLLTRSVSAIMAIFRGLVRLNGERPEREYDDLARHVARLTKGEVPAAPFERVVEIRRGTTTVAPPALAGVLADYLDGVERLVRYLDAHPASN
jgi:predicted nucleotidyltransferase